MNGYATGTWFVTGASAGFGKAIAHAVLARGGRVVATARDAATLDDILAAGGDRAIALPLDVENAEQAARAVIDAEAFGGIDVFVNNAGYGFIGGIEESGDAEIRRQMEVNFFGALALTRLALPAMRARGRGFFVNVSSIAGVRAAIGTGYYSASKFALEAVTEALRAEIAPFGLGAMIVEPGPFRTDFAGRSIRLAANPIAAYTDIAARRAALGGMDRKQAGDPVRAAEAIIDAVDAPQPPMRLVLGASAVDVVRTALETRLAELERWADVAWSVDFPAEDAAG